MLPLCMMLEAPMEQLMNNLFETTLYEVKTIRQYLSQCFSLKKNLPSPSLKFCQKT